MEKQYERITKKTTMKTLITIAFLVISNLSFSQSFKRDTIECIFLVSYIPDTTDFSIWHGAHWLEGFEVKELHNTAEGSIDPGICPDCWEYYWKHICYLTILKKPIPENVTIWMSKPKKSL
ncbi:MAG: hypothetical protein ACHQ1D_00035 [Nitrososphaerales archaeon]